MADEYIISEKFQLFFDQKEINQGLRKLGTEIRKKTRELIKQPKTGVIYGGKYSKNRSSAPGESPATQTGDLAKNISVSVKKNRLRITENEPYAVMLEGGAKGGGRAKGGKSGKSIRRGKQRIATTTRVIAPRPSLSLALEQTDVQKIVDTALENLIKKKTGES